MAIEIFAVEWNLWSRSSALTGDPNPGPKIKESPRSISARCGQCGIEFNATRSWRGTEPGRYFPLPMRNASMKCPNCGHESVESYAAY